MDPSEGFAAIAAPNATVLVLGSLPGKKSLLEQEYYAHPSNAFWPIMRAIFGIEGDYTERCEGLIANRVAVWDVLQSSVRPGSLDADIVDSTARANDFGHFFRMHSEVRSILFNGKKAEQLYRRQVLCGKAPASERPGIQMQGLPSTSPAYAAMPFKSKLAAWRSALCDRE